MKMGGTRIDTSAIPEGRWTKFVIRADGQTIEEVEFLLSLSNIELNANYRKALRAALEPHERILGIIAANKGAKLPDNVAKQINDAGRDVLMENVILGWKGVTGPDGKTDLPCTLENLQAFFLEFPELWAEVEQEAGKIERFRVSVLEATAKN